MKVQSKTDASRWLAAAVAVGLVAGCAMRSTRAIDDARRSYNAARSDPTVVTYAPAPLAEAGSTLSRAELEYKRGDDDEVNHLSYVTQQEVARAREIASEKQARSASDALSSSRTQIVQTERDRSIALALQELAALHARETSRGIELTLSDVYFEFDRADLRPSAAQDLAALASFLRENPGRAVVIEGHTDSVGSESYNLDLSRRRAAAVQSFLIAQGVDPGRISARGFGKSYPVASNDSDSGRQQNRRVDMLVLNPGTEVSLSSTPLISR